LRKIDVDAAQRAAARNLRYSHERMAPGTPSEDLLSEPESGAEASPKTAPTQTAKPAAPDAPKVPITGLVSATHAILFEPSGPRCDVCDTPLDATADREDEAEVGGHGLYVWVRHGEVVYEEPPLCAGCAAAITISALQRWAVEEEDG
jgi:hypothetical protein